MELIEGRLKAEASDAQMTERVVKVPGAAEAAVIESIYPQVPSKQLDLVIGTASGPQYSIRYGAQRSAYDEASAQRIVSSARISGGGV